MVAYKDNNGHLHGREAEKCGLKDTQSGSEKNNGAYLRKNG